MSQNTSDWNAWSMHVLNELKRLNENYDSLLKMNQEIKTELGKLSNIEKGMDDLKNWKNRVDDIFSPIQMKELVDDVQSLKTFKTTAITVWAVIQVLMGFAIKFL